MIAAVVGHIKGSLAEAGVSPSRIHASVDAVHRYQGPVPYAAVIPGAEQLERSGRRMGRETDRDTMTSVTRKRLYVRTTIVSVLIAHKTIDAVEPILEEFLRRLGRGVDDGRGNWVTIEIADGEWVDEASLNKRSVGYEAILRCVGGVYEDTKVPVVLIGEAETEMLRTDS